MNKKKAIIIKIIAAFLVIITLYMTYNYIRNRDSKDIFTLYGNVDIRDVALSFRVSGRITEMLFDEGDHVTKGTVVAKLDKDTFLVSLRSAKASLIQALANRQNANSTYNRRNKLVNSGAVSKSLYDDALASKKAQHAQVNSAIASVASTQIALNDTEIHAPTNGTILTRIREPGSVVTETQPVYTLAVDNPVWVRTYIDETQLGQIYPGQEALVYTDSDPNYPYKGHVGFISPQAEFTPKIVQTTQLRTDLVYRLRVVINNPDRGLRQGMPVTVKIHLNQDKHHEPKRHIG